LLVANFQMKERTEGVRKAPQVSRVHGINAQMVHGQSGRLEQLTGLLMIASTALEIGLVAEPGCSVGRLLGKVLVAQGAVLQSAIALEAKEVRGVPPQTEEGDQPLPIPPNLKQGCMW
jgi:hypothetical protein